MHASVCVHVWGDGVARDVGLVGWAACPGLAVSVCLRESAVRNGYLGVGCVHTAGLPGPSCSSLSHQARSADLDLVLSSSSLESCWEQVSPHATAPRAGPLHWPPPHLNCTPSWCHFIERKISSLTDFPASSDTAVAPISSTCTYFFNMYLLSTYYVSGIRNHGRQIRRLPWGAHILEGTTFGSRWAEGPPLLRCNDQKEAAWKDVGEVSS